MKNYKIYSWLFLIILLVACDSQLDLAPEDTLVEDKVFASEKTADAAVADAYHSFYEASTFFGVTYAFGDLTTDNVALANNSGYWTYVDAELTPADYVVGEVWRLHYKAINVANNLIKKIPEIGTYDETLERQHVAEGRFLRAFAYLNLLRIYGDGALTGDASGLGVVLQLEPFEGIVEEPKPRQNNGAVFNLVIEDLQLAIADLPTAHSNNERTRSRATKASAQALLSRVYLYQSDFGAAASAAQVVLADPNYFLTSDLQQLFPPNPDASPQEMTEEWLFGFPVSTNNGNFQYGTNYLDLIYYFKNNAWADAAFIDLYDTADLRRQELIFAGFAGNPNLTTFKFNNPEGLDNVPMLRLAEVILTRAESLARTNGLVPEAVDLLNQIRQRAGLTSFDLADFSNADDLVNAILHERRLELAFEGLHRFDLIRTGQPLKNPDVPTDRFAWPIPQYEIELSGGVVVQNPGYE